MRVPRLILVTLVLGLACGTLADDDAIAAEFGTQIADIFQSLSGIQNQTSSLMASAGTDYTSTMNSWLSALKPQTQGVTANLDWSSIAKSFTSGDLVSKLTKLGAASVATKVLVESGWWKDISESLDQADGLFESLPVAGKVAELAGNLLNGTKDALKEVGEMVDALEEKYCTTDFAIEKEVVPTSCVGHNVTLSIGNGFCIFQADKTIRCRKPSVVLVKTAAECALKHHEAVIVKGKECKFQKSWGEGKQGYLFPHTGPVHYNLTKSVVEPGPVHDIAQGYGNLLNSLNARLSQLGSSFSDWGENAKTWFSKA